MDDSANAGQTLVGWFKSLAWIYFAAYGVGLVSSRVSESLIGYPQLGPESLLELRSLLFGLSMMALSLLVHGFVLFYLYTFVASDYAPRSGYARVLAHLLFAVLTCAVLFRLARIVTGTTAGAGPAIRVTIMLTTAVCAGIAGGLRGWRRISSGSGPNQAGGWRPVLAAVGIGKQDSQKFIAATWLVVLALVAGVALYPRASPSLGGGAGVPVVLLTGDSATRTDSVRLLRRDGEYLLFTPLDSVGCATDKLVAVKTTVVDGFRSLPPSCDR